MPSLAHQRTTTYVLTGGDPAKIDLTTEYKLFALLEPPADALHALTGCALPFARSAEAEAVAHRLSLLLTSIRPWADVPAPEPRVVETVTLKTQGVIRIDGDRLTYVVSNPGGPRPTSFHTTPGDGLTKVTLVRVR